MGFEVDIVQSIYSLIGRSSILDYLIEILAVYLPYAFIGGVIWFFLRHPWRESVYGFCFAALTVIGARGIFTELIRFFYDRPRPYEILNFDPIFLSDNPAFPSGHAALLFALALSIFFFNKKIGWLFLALALLNGAGRVFAGVHWPLDIVGGFIVALFSFLVMRKLPGSNRNKLTQEETPTS